MSYLAPAIAAIVGWICWYLLEISPGEHADKSKIISGFIAVLFGLLTEVLIELFIQRYEFNKKRQRDSDETRATLKHIEGLQTELLETIKPKILKGEEVGHLLNFEGRRLSTEHVIETWIDLLLRLKGSYCATNYIRRIYDSDWATAAFLIQNAKRKANRDKISIRKVFLIDDDGEIPSFSEHLDEQKKIGIDIHFLPMKEVAKDPVLSGQLASGAIPSPDFGVFEDHHVLVWTLNNRTLVGGQVLLHEDDARRHREFFERLFRKAVEYNEDRLILIPMPEHIAETINRWPRYEVPYEEMDYALRSPHGWLYKYGSHPGCKKFAAYADGVLIGFSLLDADTHGEAEFYVAIHPDYLKRKFGRKVTEETLRLGFKELRFKSIHLKVRKDLQHRIRLYAKSGFQPFGAKNEMTNGELVDFLLMRISAAEYKARTEGA